MHGIAQPATIVARKEHLKVLADAGHLVPGRYLAVMRGSKLPLIGRGWRQARGTRRQVAAAVAQGSLKAALNAQTLAVTALASLYPFITDFNSESALRSSLLQHTHLICDGAPSCLGQAPHLRQVIPRE